MLPLVVDLDGTLTRTDTLVEGALRILRRSFRDAYKLLLCLTKGRVAFKAYVANNSRLQVDRLPYDIDLLEYLRRQKAAGRTIILATASHKIVAEQVAAHVGLFDGVIATEDDGNLKGRRKLSAIRDLVGRDFVYAGDSSADIPIWQEAQGAVLVRANRRTVQRVRNSVSIEFHFPRPAGKLYLWLRAIRSHQWLKNLLVFVPALTSFSLVEPQSLANATIAFLAFSFTASAIYLVNDIWDIDSDRNHASKRNRPVANSQMPIPTAAATAGVFLVTGLALSVTISMEFLSMLLLYVLITTSYTLVWKRYVLMDVIVLAVLYTLRVLAGAVAIDVPASTWLLAFSIFLFLSLALMKRCTELKALEESGKTKTSGRDYHVGDLTVLWPLGVSAGIASVVVFGLFVSDSETVARYASPDLLWFVALALTYWLSRLWIKTARGEMHEDPVVYAMKDRNSRVVIVFMITIVLLAHSIDWLPSDSSKLL